MKVLLAGLWARRAVNAACLLVIVLATAASLLGPMYGRASAEHLLDTRIDARAPYTTGLTYSVPALTGDNIPVGSPDKYRPPDPSGLVAEAADALRTGSVAEFWLPGRAWIADRGGTLAVGARDFEAPLYWREGMCDLAEVRGRCPSRAGDVLVQEVMAEALDVGVGDQVVLTYQDAFQARSGGESARTRKRAFDVVGTYQITDPESPAWFDLSRFAGIETLKAPPPPTGAGDPAAPALFAAPDSMTSQSVVGGVDRPIDKSAVNLDSMSSTAREAERYASAVLDVSTSEQLADIDVASLFDEVDAERALLSQVTLAALAPFVVLALLLLYGLVSSAAQMRRPYVALAKLRGHSTTQVFRFALTEPFLVVVAGTLLGAGLAVLAAHLVAWTWLTPGVPVVVGRAGAVSLAAVVLGALVASVAAALAVIREPLAGSLAASVQSRPSSRAALVLKSAVVAVAVASVAQILTSGGGSAQLLGLLAPLSISLAVAVGGVLLLTVGSRWWVRRTKNRAGTASYLAARRLARRHDLTRLMIPLLLAVSVISFAASTSATADDWRVSRARAEVGAPRTFLTDASAGRLLEVTRRVDPEGRYVAAAAVDETGDDMSRRVLFDTSRMSAVAAWDESWSDVPLTLLEQRVTPGPGDRITFAGRRITVDLRDVRLRTSSTDSTSALWAQYVDDTGEQADVALGELRNGARSSLTAELDGCADRCVLEQIYLSGDSSSVTDAQGELTIADVAIDGQPVDWRLREDGAWRPARPFPVSLVDPPVTLDPGPSGLRVEVYLGKLPPGDGPPPVMLSGIARITPSDTPGVVPVLITSGLDPQQATVQGSGIALDFGDDAVVGAALNGGQVPMQVVGRVRALPGLGDEGALSDLETSLVEFEPPTDSVLQVQLWMARGTPAAVLDEVRDSGIALSSEDRVEATLGQLRSDAFSLGLRIFLIVAGATLLLATFGVLASAVTQSRWRSYEVASLRVVGVSRRTLLRASVLEYVVMLGSAVLLGLVSALLALTLVLPSISLGSAAEHDPAAAYSLHWQILAAVGCGIFALAVVIALLVSRRITRLGRPSTLRWAEQG